MLENTNLVNENKESVKCQDNSICTYDDITNSAELKYESSIIKNNLKKHLIIIIKILINILLI